jgi:hypothetical protein
MSKHQRLPCPPGTTKFPSGETDTEKQVETWSRWSFAVHDEQIVDIELWASFKFHNSMGRFFETVTK